jgi:DNA-binding TFAR19-related protein (PDSD5 family)
VFNNIIAFLLLVMFSRQILRLLLRMASSGMLRRVALVRTDVSEECSASIIRVTRIGELGTTLAVTTNRRTLVFLRVS